VFQILIRIAFNPDPDPDPTLNPNADPETGSQNQCGSGFGSYQTFTSQKVNA
jgi:hypothetical protein